VVWSGGDFMAGRMLSAPLVLAVGIVVSSEMVEGSAPWSLVPAVALLGAMALHSPLGRNALERGDNLMNNGVADERGFYFGDNGLLNYNRDAVFPGGNGQINAHQTRERGIRVVEFGQNGLFAFFAGPTVHVIDNLGLGDPLLSRLPAVRPWRPGHYRRELPSGYRESIESGTNQIQDAAIAAYYERLSLIVRGPIWDRRRLAAIIRMNLGAYDHWLPVVATPAP
jgi:arabinofuranosyltransferase